MFSSFLDSSNKLLVNRLSRAQAAILNLSLSTKEEYLAQVTSLVNKVINTGYGMQPLTPLGGETAAVVGDPINNLLSLNLDASDIADEIARLEDNASVLYNLSAASLNSICQQIREALYESGARLYNEQFINKNQIDAATTSSLDLNAGVAQLPLGIETALTPSFAVGLGSIGSTASDINALATDSAETLFVWNGSELEVIASFDSPTILNRVIVTPDSYVGYELTAFTASSDGSLYENILDDFGFDSVLLDATAGKYTGTATLDFAPRSVTKVRMVFKNLTSGDQIGLRALLFYQRSYQNAGQVVSAPQTYPTGDVTFRAESIAQGPFVSITHQISADSVHYTTIQPGTVSLPAKWWYRALLNRSQQAFQNASAAVSATTSDPLYSSGFTLVSSKSIPLDETTIERTLVLSGISAPIPLTETPIPGTLRLSRGSLYLTDAQFSLSEDNQLTIASPTGSITVVYQTSAQGAKDLPSLANYYTPLLSSVQFEAQ